MKGLAIEKEFLFTIFTTIQGIKNTFIDENIIPGQQVLPANYSQDITRCVHPILRRAARRNADHGIDGNPYAGFQKPDYPVRQRGNSTERRTRLVIYPLQPATGIRTTYPGTHGCPFSPITFTASCKGLKTSNYCTLMSRKA